MAMVITQKFWEIGGPPPFLGKIPKKYRFFWKSPLIQKKVFLFWIKVEAGGFLQNLKLPYYKKLELEPDELDSIMGDLEAMPWRNKE